MHGARRLEVGQHGQVVALLETEPQETGLADRAARHLRRLVLERREFDGGMAERLGQGPRSGARQSLGGTHHAGCRSGSFRSNSRSLRIRSTSCGMPSPVLQFVKMNGLSPRMIRES